MNIAKLDQNGLAIEAGYIRVYVVDPVTQAYSHSTDEFLMPGVGLPPNCYRNAPFAAKSGFAVIRDGEQWQYIVDHRGKVVYSTETQQEKIVSELGEIVSNFTLLQPQTPFERWDGSRWVIDDAAKRAAEIDVAKRVKQDLDEEAKDAITRLQYAIDYQMALDGDEQKLMQWQQYRVLLDRIDLDAAPNIQWPSLPN